MKIITISHMYPSTFSVSTELFIHQQVLALSRLGHEIKVISPVPFAPFPFKLISEKWKRYSKVPQKMIWDGIDAYYPNYYEFPKALLFHSSGRRMYYGIRKMVKSIYRTFKFDIIHAHVAVPDGYAGMLIAKDYKKPLVVTVHGMDFQQTIFRNDKCKNNVKKVVDYSSKIIVVSNKLRTMGIEKLNIESDKIITINNGIFQSDIFVRKSQLLKEYTGKIILLSVSNLIETKGIDLNLKAFVQIKKKFPKLVYIIIGDGPEKKNLIDLSKKLGIDKDVKFLFKEAKDHDIIMEYMSICDIFVLPSWKEGFGIVYIEAMASGKPVVACSGEGPTEFIKDHETGILIRPKSIESIIEALDYLLSNPKKAAQIASSGKNLILEKYTWEKISSKIADIYGLVVK